MYIHFKLKLSLLWRSVKKDSLPSQAYLAGTTWVWTPDNIYIPTLECRSPITVMKQSGVEVPEIIKPTRKQILTSSGIVLRGMRKSCLGVQPCTALFRLL